MRIAKGREVVGSCPSCYIILTTIPIELLTSLISVYRLEESIIQALIHMYILFSKLLALSLVAFSAF
jgi:hypothetical protein